MKAEIKKLPQSQVEILIKLDPTEWGKFIDEAAREFSRDVKIDGFRPGQAPRAVVEQKVGLGKILEKAADLAVKENYVKAVRDNKLDVIGRPEIQVLKPAADNLFEFKVKVAVMPEVKLGDYYRTAKSEKQVKREDIKVEDKEVAESLIWLQKSRTKYVTVSRPAKMGDRVEVDFWVRQNEQVIEGGQSKNHPLILGESRFVPGFEEQLVDMKEGETKKFLLPFPADYHVKNLAGQRLDFEVKMNLVQESLVPELTDEFAKSLGQFTDLAGLKQNVKEGLIEEKMQKAKEAWRGRVLEKIMKVSQTEVPPALVEMERVKMMEEFKNNLAQMGLEFDVYLENLKKTEQELLKEWSGKAEERVKGALVLEAIANKEEIQVTAAEIEAEINKTFAHYPDWQALESQIDKKQLSEYTKGRLRNEKVFELLEKF